MSDEKTDSSSSSLSLTAAAQVAKDLMELAKNDDNTKTASKNFGESAVIISKTVRNCLLPLAAVNFGIEKAKLYFEKNFKKDLEEKTQSIPAENIVEPKASIAGPALQGLAFCHEEVNLKEMYLNLVSSAMNSDKAEDTHPAFVEIIKQLTSLEAHLLRLYLNDSAPKGIGRVLYQKQGTIGYIVGYTHILPISSNTQPYYNKNIPSYIENWIRLGLIEVKYDLHLDGHEEAYNALKERDEYLKDDLGLGTEYPKILGKGLMKRTPFGAQFADIVGLTN